MPHEVCPSRRSTEAGFTLIEALIAMVVLTLVAAVLLRGAVAVRSDAAWFADHTTSTLLAISLLDGAIADRGLRDGTYRGERNGLPYTLVASPAGLEAGRPPARPDSAETATKASYGTPEATGTDRASPPWRLQHIVVRVQGPSRPVVLETIRLALAP